MDTNYTLQRAPLAQAGIPAVGLGTYLQSSAEAKISVQHALKVGYRHVDTAEFYDNHSGIKEALADFFANGGGEREEVFITDKVNPGGVFGQEPRTYNETVEQVQKSCQILGVTYVDLFLLHHPGGGVGHRTEQWKALLHCKNELKLIRSAGVSNFSIKHLQELEDAGLELPAVNQIECHPCCTQESLVVHCKNQGIHVVAYSSLAPASGYRIEEGQASSKKERQNAEVKVVLDIISAKYSVSEARVLLKWALVKGFSILPKSNSLERIELNAKLWDFVLTMEEVRELDGLERNEPVAWPGLNPLDWD